MRIFIVVLAVALTAPACAQVPPLRGDRSDKPRAVEPKWAEVSEAAKSGQVLGGGDFEKRALGGARNDQKKSAFVNQYPSYVQSAAAINVPVLMPMSAVKATATNFVTGTTYYAFNATYPNDVYASVTGMCAGVPLPASSPLLARLRKARDARPEHAKLGTRYEISETEGGHMMSFTKFGCAYEIDLSCPNGCDGPQTLQSLSSELGVINAR